MYGILKDYLRNDDTNGTQNASSTVWKVLKGTTVHGINIIYDVADVQGEVSQGHGVSFLLSVTYVVEGFAGNCSCMGTESVFCAVDLIDQLPCQVQT